MGRDQRRMDEGEEEMPRVVGRNVFLAVSNVPDMASRLLIGQLQVPTGMFSRCPLAAAGKSRTTG